MKTAPKIFQSTQNSGLDPLEMHQKIREVAYEKFEKRGCEHGHDLDDWLEAESEVSFARSKSATAA